MSARKFFKSDRSRSSIPINPSIIEDFESTDVNEQETSDNRRKISQPIPPIIPNVDNEDESSQDSLINDDSDSSGFHSPSSMNDAYDFTFDDFEPIFRCSTPNRDQELEINQDDSNQNDQEKGDIWRRALQKNENLRNWVEKFNQEIETIDQTELIVRSIDDKD